jgi:hypothetical protein
VPDLVDVQHREITERLRELFPLVEEYRRLEAAVSALDGIAGSTGATSAQPRRGPGRTRGSRIVASTPQGNHGRPNGSDNRARRALALVKQQPGITISEIAAKAGINQTYLYSALPGLSQAGKVTLRGAGWHPRP